MDHGNFQLLKLTIESGVAVVTVAKIEGIARGGGSGTQRLPRLAGRGRALEIILGCGDFDAETAEVESGALEDLLRRLP